MEYRSSSRMSDTLEAPLPTCSLSLQTKEEEDEWEAMSMGVVRHLPSPLLAS